MPNLACVFSQLLRVLVVLVGGVALGGLLTVLSVLAAGVVLTVAA